MRPSFPLSLFLLPVSALQIPSLFADFALPEDALSSNETSIPKSQHDLLKRDGNCPVNHNSCSTLQAAAGGACCTAGSTCTRDGGGNVACCPTGATCTGTVTIGTGTALGGGGTVFVSAATSTTTPGITAAPTTTTTASFVQNSYFPFPYIATSYANSAACNSAYNACQTNYAGCTNALEGNAFGVTVVAPDGAGVTVDATATNVGSASATSICSSLSAQACYNIQSSNCAQFGTGTETGGQFIVATAGNHAARPTVGCVAAAGLMAGLGIAGHMI